MASEWQRAISPVFGARASVSLSARVRQFAGDDILLWRGVMKKTIRILRLDTACITFNVNEFGINFRSGDESSVGMLVAACSHVRPDMFRHM